MYGLVGEFVGVLVQLVGCFCSLFFLVPSKVCVCWLVLICVFVWWLFFVHFVFRLHVMSAVSASCYLSLRCFVVRREGSGGGGRPRSCLLRGSLRRVKHPYTPPPPRVFVASTQCLPGRSNPDVPSSLHCEDARTLIMSTRPHAFSCHPYECAVSKAVLLYGQEGPPLCKFY